MNNPFKRNQLALLLPLLSVMCPQHVAAHPEYVTPTGAEGCTSCHLDIEGNGYRDGVLAASKSPLGLIEGLKAFLKPAPNNTAPVLHPINSKWDVTVGELPVVIALQITDKEGDEVIVHGSAPIGYTLSPVYIKNNLPTIDFTWLPTPAQANKSYPLSIYVQETKTGSKLKSNTISTTVQVWPARSSLANQVTQFSMESAKWQGNVLTLTGQLAFKNTLTATQRKTALATLNLNVKSNFGKIIVNATKLTLDSKGSWVKKITLDATHVPCAVKLTYEGLRSARSVSSAPSATCVK